MRCKKSAPPSSSASDLVGHLHCRHLTALDVEVANGRLEKPEYWDPFQEILQERGRRHEEGYIEHLKLSGLAVCLLEGVGVHRERLARTREATEVGADVHRPGRLPAENVTVTKGAGLVGRFMKTEKSDRQFCTKCGGL